MTQINPSWPSSRRFGLIATTGIIATGMVVLGSALWGLPPFWSPLGKVFGLRSHKLYVLPMKVATGKQVESIEEAIASSMAELEKNLTFAVPKFFQGKTIEKVFVSNGEKVIALTFDDGPWPKHTEGILNVLRKEKVLATFYWIGEHLNEFPNIAPKVIADGHAIANHTWNHHYHNVDKNTAAKELGSLAELIYKLTRVKTSIFRPPGGVLDNGLVSYAQNQNYVVTMWSSDAQEASYPSVQGLINNVLNSASPGGIVLMHDGGGDRSTTVQALPTIIKELKRRGYKFVTLPKLLEMGEQDSTSKSTPTLKRAADTNARSISQTDTGL